MTVFSNTTPFLALSSTDRLSLLPRLFTTVHVAESVARECAQGVAFRAFSWNSFQVSLWKPGHFIEVG